MMLCVRLMPYHIDAGIGLDMPDRAVMRHDGPVRVESKPGKGLIKKIIKITPAENLRRRTVWRQSKGD
ncbi:MAG: hypothetical protein IH613_11110 [Desulfuromonadales bacterium]|nr:hypothetical protein [Desulfuromonadales bacterium]